MSKGPPRDVVRAEAMWRLYDSGMTLKIVGEVYSISPQSVSRMLRRHGRSIRAEGRPLAALIAKPKPEFVAGCKMPSDITITAAEQRTAEEAFLGSRALLMAYDRYFQNGGRG